MQGTVKHQKSINVWGCFSWNGVEDLHRVKGIMTGPVYRQILTHHLVPSARRLCGNNVFQHDNDSSDRPPYRDQRMPTSDVTIGVRGAG